MQFSLSKSLTLALTTGLGMDMVLADCCRVNSNPLKVRNISISCTYADGVTPFDNNMIATCIDLKTGQQVGKVWLECVRGGNCGPGIGPNIIMTASTERRLGVILSCGGEMRSVWQCAGRSNSDGKAAIAPCEAGKTLFVYGADIPDTAQCVVGGSPP